MAQHILGYLEVSDAKGESTSEAYKDQIEVLAFGFGEGQKEAVTASSTGSLTTGTPAFLPIGIVKAIDKATPNLHALCAGSKELDKATLTLVRTIDSKEKEYFSITLEKLVVFSVVTAGSNQPISFFGGEDKEGIVLPNMSVESDLPLEAVCLLPSKITWKYTETKGGKTGSSTEKNFDRATNKAG